MDDQVFSWVGCLVILTTIEAVLCRRWPSISVTMDSYVPISCMSIVFLHELLEKDKYVPCKLCIPY